MLAGPTKQDRIGGGGQGHRFWSPAQSLMLQELPCVPLRSNSPLRGCSNTDRGTRRGATASFPNFTTALSPQIHQAIQRRENPEKAENQTAIPSTSAICLHRPPHRALWGGPGLGSGTDPTPHGRSRCWPLELPLNPLGGPGAKPEKAERPAPTPRGRSRPWPRGLYWARG